MALRLAYQLHVEANPRRPVELLIDIYQQSFDRFVQHGEDMRQVVEALDDSAVAASARWNQIDQHAVDAAFRDVICEREPIHGINVATLALTHYAPQWNTARRSPAEDRDRPLRPSDNNAAWDRSGGRCSGCGTRTIRHSQRERLHRVMMAHQHLFRREPVYRQYNGVEAPLWPQVTIAAKGVADHVEARSHGGRTTEANLVNVCAGCNYGRNHVALEFFGAPAYECRAR